MAATPPSCPTPRSQSHSAHVGFRAFVRYRWHPGFGTEIDVQSREVSNRGEEVFVCVSGDGTRVAIPAWMFDAATCEPMALAAARASVKALQELRVLDMQVSGSASDLARAWRADLRREHAPITVPAVCGRARGSLTRLSPFAPCLA